MFITAKDRYKVDFTTFLLEFRDFGGALTRYWETLILREAGEPDAEHLVVLAQAELDKQLARIGAALDPAGIRAHYEAALANTPHPPLFARVMGRARDPRTAALETTAHALCSAPAEWRHTTFNGVDAFESALLFRCAAILRDLGVADGEHLVAFAAPRLDQAARCIKRLYTGSKTYGPADVILEYRAMREQRRQS